MSAREPIRVPRPHFIPPTTRTEEAPEPGTLAAAVHNTRQWLLDQQQPAGFWCAELEGDSILQSEYILLLAWLRRENLPIAKKCAQRLIDTQLPTGGWAMYPGGELEISGSVKAYFALKLTGHDRNAEYMVRARDAIRAAGGADAVNSFTRFYLALLGQISYDHCPAVPPELVLLPKWSPINIYRMSAWSRTIVVPLAIMWAHRPVRQLAPDRSIGELFLKQPDHWPELKCPGLEQEQSWFSWDKFFRRADQSIKWLERRKIKPLRKRALKVATQWMTTRFAHSDGLGAIFPPIIWSIIALKCLGYDDDSAEVRYNHEQLAGLTVEEETSAHLQPCLSPVWDTAITVRALAASGVTIDDQSLIAAIDWLLEKEVTRPGDWAANVNAAPAGWFFEHHNDFYPDIDDTVMVMIAVKELLIASESSAAAKPVNRELQHPRSSSDMQIDEADARRRWAIGACERARRWVLAMQNKDGGWGAFDKDNDSEFLCRVPFADHNAMIDPSTPDLTGRVLEALAHWGAKRGQPAVDRALQYLRETQESDGSWFGRWGVNYIYGTWQVLVGLNAIDIAKDDPLMQRAANWLLTHQQASGAWGESADTYEKPHLRGQGPATASQTAWALLGLLAAGLAEHPAVERGVQWLVDQQQEDGTWAETEFTGTGFPRVFYLKYHAYPIYFPLLALATYANARGQELPKPQRESVSPRLRVVG
ncbi:Squalene--hopene cyclase [Anatilimnocola aggregata]|uniref:Squalene--hopene cyclase n=1 Tax=Anatilimnocola aggregata TaxID=2528021 RepID=A0A517YLF8_9BACT|nr:prenyltransferase/squalene oxidase repeat-containing protein [Anatilimnocola aggregata]QDU31076.1 Squalene--hopene cyclase [Anatilimnocola aggregata]